MLALFVSLGDSVYAIPARSVVEVVPHVALRVVELGALLLALGPASIAAAAPVVTQAA